MKSVFVRQEAEAGVDFSEEGVAKLFNMIDEDGSDEIDQEKWQEAADLYLEMKLEEEEMARMEMEADDTAVQKNFVLRRLPSWALKPRL